MVICGSPAADSSPWQMTTFLTFHKFYRNCVPVTNTHNPYKCYFYHFLLARPIPSHSSPLELITPGIKQFQLIEMTAVCMLPSNHIIPLTRIPLSIEQSQDICRCITAVAGGVIPDKSKSTVLQSTPQRQPFGTIIHLYKIQGNEYALQDTVHFTMNSDFHNISLPNSASLDRSSSASKLP